MSAPLARALIGKAVGDTVPIADGEAEIVAIADPSRPLRRTSDEMCSIAVNAVDAID